MTLRRFKLKVGSFVQGSGPSTKWYNASKPGQNVVESEVNLAAKHPEKFELLEEVGYREPASAGEPDHPAPTAAAPAQTAQAVSKSSRPKQLTQKELEAMSEEDLRNLAAAEEYSVQGAVSKTSLIKAILKAQSQSL